MQFAYLVYYLEQSDYLSWQDGNKYKMIRAKNEKEALEKFNKKYPDLRPMFATK